MPPSERRNAQLSPSPSKSGVPAENTTYLKLEKPCVLFLEGSGAPPRRLSLPPPCSLTPRRRSPAPLRCAQPPLLTARRRVPLRPQRVPAPLPPLRPLVAGAEDSTSRGGAPRRSPLLPPPPTKNFPGSSGERALCCSRSWYSSLSCSRRSRRRILFSFPRAARSRYCRCMAWATARAWGVGGLDCVTFTITLC
jgi:hypothetical protein